MRRRDELDEFGDRLKATQLRISQEMERQGLERYRTAVVGIASYLPAAIIVFAIALVFGLHWVFYIFAAVLLVAAIRSWLNMRDMERFIEAVRQDILEIQK